jgi:hypothetical protein
MYLDPQPQISRNNCQCADRHRYAAQRAPAALGWIERAVGDDCDARSTVQSIKNPILPNLGGVGRNRIREPIMTLPTLWIFPVRRPFCENIRQHVLRGVNSRSARRSVTTRLASSSIFLPKDQMRLPRVRSFAQTRAIVEFTSPPDDRFIKRNLAP